MNYFKAFELTLFCLAFWGPVGVLLVYLKKKDRPIKREPRAKFMTRGPNVCRLVRAVLIMEGIDLTSIYTRGRYVY